MMNIVKIKKEGFMTDHEFAAWLNKKGRWSYERLSHIAAIRFLVGERVVAIATYDNQKCTRHIYLCED